MMIRLSYLILTMVLVHGVHGLPVFDPANSATDLPSNDILPVNNGGILVTEGKDDQGQTSVPSGTLLLPEPDDVSKEQGKKCMTVCARWGEDCTYINRGAGGTTRSCRRTCQQFTQECF